MQKDSPIVSSRLQKDWYYVTQNFFVWLLFRDVRVRYKFTNRNFPKIRLAERVDLGQLREEIAHVKSLSYTDEEIAWLRANFHEALPNGFLMDEYLDHLRTARLSDVHVDIEETPEGRRLVIEPDGLWHEGMDWETFILPIVVRLNALAVLREHGVSEREVIAEAMYRLGRKIEKLKAHPDVLIGSFGLRRQYSFELSRMIDERLVRDLPDQLLGISNVWMAKELDRPVIGTFAHQLPMVYVAMAMAMEYEDVDVRAAHMTFFDDWERVFPKKWRTAVSDTFGSDTFFEDFGPERAARWDKWKQDSGNPFNYADRLEAWLREMGVKPGDNLFNPTDSLNPDKMIALTAHARGRFKATAGGWGTNCTNDTGLHTYGSFVIKPDLVTLPDGRSAHAVKLSDNIKKATGDRATVERVKRIFGYTTTFAEECVV